MRSSKPAVRGTSSLATGILVLGIAPFGIAATGDALREGVRNGTATKETEIVSNNGHGLLDPPVQQVHHRRRRHLRLPFDRGRLRAPTRPRTRASARTTCPRASRSSSTPRARRAPVSITVGAGGDAKKPFTTNATGVATGLNADRVDGVEAAALKSRWLLVNEAGQIEEQSGGFTILDAYQTNQNVYIDSGASLEGKGLQATIAIQNKINVERRRRRAPTRTSAARSASRAARPSRSSARPPNSKTPNAFVFSARSDGANGRLAQRAGTDTSNPRKRVYIHDHGVLDR